MRMLWGRIPFGPHWSVLPLLMGRPGGLVAALVLSAIATLAVAVGLELRRNRRWPE